MTLDPDTTQGFGKIHVTWQGISIRKAPLRRRAVGCLPFGSPATTLISHSGVGGTQKPRLVTTAKPFLRNGVRLTLFALQRGEFVVMVQESISGMHMGITLATTDDEFHWLVLIMSSQVMHGNKF